MLTAERTPADSMHTDFTVLAFCVVSLTAVDDTRILFCHRLQQCFGRTARSILLPTMMLLNDLNVRLRKKVLRSTDQFFENIHADRHIGTDENRNLSGGFPDQALLLFTVTRTRQYAGQMMPHRIFQQAGQG